MKNYISPEMNIIVLAVEDVITISYGDIEVEAGGENGIFRSL